VCEAVIWAETGNGRWESGIYRIIRGIKLYTVWRDLPKNMQGFGGASTLRDAKLLCELDRKEGLKALARDLA
jgi:hypothetical protein